MIDPPVARHPGRRRDIARNRDLFWSYLDGLTLRAYRRDFFTSDNHRVIACFIWGVLCFGFGVGRMFVHPGWQSLGVVFVGIAVALFCFTLPLLLDLMFAYAGVLSGGSRRPRGRRVKR